MISCSIECWLNGPLDDNVVLHYGSDIDLDVLTAKTKCKIIVVYGIEAQADIDESGLFPHHLKIEPINIIVLSKYPIYNVQQATGKIRFCINAYTFDVAKKLSSYQFGLKYLPTVKPIIHSKTQLSRKISLLKANN